MRILRFVLVLALIAIGAVAWMYRTAVADPVVRHARVALAGLPVGTEITALLVSDLHVAGPDMPPERLARVVRRINLLDPDVVLIAGDLVSDKALGTTSYSLRDAVAPLRSLRPRLGTYAVLGNHDHWRDARDARRQLARVGATVLDNTAARAGPLAIGGLDDAFTGHDDLGATVLAMRSVGGAPVLLSHSPDPFAKLPASVGLMLAGHTHCGQIRLPLIGALSYMSEYGDRFACGVVREGGKTLVVGAGLGTSVLPLRLGAVPDMWLVRIVGALAPQAIH